jgi:hypothetical protein
MCTLTKWRDEMTTLANLKLVAATKPTALAPIVQKRNKLIKRLHEQIELATALAEGRDYVVTRLRTVIDDETKITKTVSTPKRVKQWWWTAANGKVCVTVRYGAKVIELAKGLTAVELNSKDELVGVLTTLKGAVELGELDLQINAVSGAVKSSFKK